MLFKTEKVKNEGYRLVDNNVWVIEEKKNNEWIPMAGHFHASRQFANEELSQQMYITPQKAGLIRTRKYIAVLTPAPYDKKDNGR